MIRLLINETLRQYAKELRKELARLTNNPQKKLEELMYSEELSPSHKEYVKKIHDEWNELIICEPDKFDDVKGKFDEILLDNQLSERVGDKKFYEIIVDKMEYSRVQSTIYPKIMRKLGIKACVYCNAQYAYSIIHHSATYTNYELDHFKPKSKYPFLCTSFFNLQPCCSSCNKNKSDDDALFCLYTKREEELNPMKFSIDIGSSARYWVTHNPEMIKIKYSCPRDEALEQNQENVFHITDLYQGHTDIVEELLWKKKIYNSPFIDIYRRNFKQLGFTDASFKRLIIGNYSLTVEVHKRPLSKMTQDIAKDLELI